MYQEMAGRIKDRSPLVIVVPLSFHHKPSIYSMAWRKDPM
jgi:hypothetical protein